MNKTMLSLRNYPFDDLFDLIDSSFNYDSKNDYLLSEENDSYLISLSVPGISKKDIEIKLDDNLIDISYDRKKSDNKSKFTKTFNKKFKLPEDSDIKNINAKSEDGILTITIPKIEIKKTNRVIEIQ